MGNLYRLSLANSFMDYDWCNLLKHNRFRRGVTVLWPECYTLEVKLRTIDTVYNTNTAQLWELGSCIPPLPVLSCYAASIGFPMHCLFQYIISHTVQYSKTFKHTYISLMSYGARSGLNFIQVIFPVLWRSSRVSWGSGFWCPYGWSIAGQNFCKTDRNNIVSMVVIKTIWCMYTFFGIKMVKIDIATSYLVLATSIGVWLYLQNCKSKSVLVASIFKT